MLYYLKIANVIHYSERDIGRADTLQNKKLYNKIILVSDNKPIPPLDINAVSTSTTLYAKKTGNKITAYSLYEGYKKLTGNQVEELNKSIEPKTIQFPDTTQNRTVTIDESQIVEKLRSICGYTDNMQNFILRLMVMKIYYVYKVLRLDTENVEANKMWNGLCQMEKTKMLDYLFTKDYLTTNQKYELLGNIFNKDGDNTFRKHFIDDANTIRQIKMPDYLKELYGYYKQLQDQHAMTHTTIVKQASRDPNNVFAWLPNEIKSEIIQRSASDNPETINDQVHKVLLNKRHEGPSSVLQTIHNEQIIDRIILLLHTISQHKEELFKARNTQLFPVNEEIDSLNQQITVMKVLERYLRGETALNTLETTIHNNPLYNKILLGKSEAEDFVRQARALCDYLVPGSQIVARQRVKPYIALLKQTIALTSTFCKMKYNSKR